jgi:pyruvate,orthophosphate dikinase
MTSIVADAARSTAPRNGSTTGEKRIYFFGKSWQDGRGLGKELLGGKGANLAEMAALGLPVPPGFTITTKVCDEYYKIGQRLPAGLMDEVRTAIAKLEGELGKAFGDRGNPLLVSVRSGAAASMPGMMNTILNLGLNDESVEGLARSTGNARFAFDAYRRLINMFGDVVLGIDHDAFEHEFKKIKKKYRAANDTDVPEKGMRRLVAVYKEVFAQHAGTPFPQDPFEQLEAAIKAVFASWNTDRAVTYRRVENIQGLLGTAVNVQSMVYGNMGDDSGTGVAFTRDPATGENELYGEFLVNAQGEDVVAGIRTPQNLSEMAKWNPQAYAELLEIKRILEDRFLDMQDIEFTVERGRLFMLQTRTGKRTGMAAVRIACDLVDAGWIDPPTALLRIPANDLTQLLLPSFDPQAKRAADVLVRGRPASPGAAVGRPAFTAHEAVERAERGETVILVRKETSPEDIEGMHKAVGILTSTGGMTSHAAVVARGWGRCCVVGASDLYINEKKRTMSVGDKTLGPNDTISLDGTTGEVIIGEVAMREPTLSGGFQRVMEWSNQYRTLNVRTNADTPEDARRAREFGAEGIGLCRTEHMFFGEDRIAAMREMILANKEADRRLALARLLPYQRQDFIGIFEAMNGLSVTIRLLDPPLHEFLPHDAASQAALAKQLGVRPAIVKRRVSQLKEVNPMLGHRGCRLSITYPEILDMQVTAIVEAALDCRRRGIDVKAEIMIPLVGMAIELALLRRKTEETIARVLGERGEPPLQNLLIGTMIEIPRAAVVSDAIAAHADFFSFGTNDLTQMTFGFSRDDVGSFLPGYLNQDLLADDPFITIDQEGVGHLMELSIRLGRRVRPELKVGICGEHGGDPRSVDFCHRLGMNYVSCSPFRVPVARLAAAQAALRHNTQAKAKPCEGTA